MAHWESSRRLGGARELGLRVRQGLVPRHPKLGGLVLGGRTEPRCQALCGSRRVVCGGQGAGADPPPSAHPRAGLLKNLGEVRGQEQPGEQASWPWLRPERPDQAGSVGLTRQTKWQRDGEGGVGAAGIPGSAGSGQARSCLRLLSSHNHMGPGPGQAGLEPEKAQEDVPLVGSALCLRTWLWPEVSEASAAEFCPVLRQE